MATLRGDPVDRAAVSFYEIGGFKTDPDDPDPFNIYNAPSWRPLLDLAERHTDLIRMRRAVGTPSPRREDFFLRQTWCEGRCRLTKTTATVAGRTLRSVAKRQPETDTVWVVEHLLKDLEDLHAYLELPDEALAETVDVAPLAEEDKALGESGIVMVNMEDPLCAAASLFSMEDFAVIALTEPAAFHRLLEKCARSIYASAEQVARRFPGHLWRIVGSEYASEPFLPPALYAEYEVRYTVPMVTMVQRHGGFARLHSHGRLRRILPQIHAMGVDALDPIEPPPQGDVTLAEVRRQYGREMVLFGNLEITDIENMPPGRFERVAAQALQDGTAGTGRGFVLMPSSAPFGREITPVTLANYETMVRLVHGR